MKRVLVLLIGVGLCPLSSVRGEPPGEFKLNDGDRVVLLGNTLIEREQRYGYWETLLTCRYPDKNVTFRNLGWSGDTVFGDARAGFGSTADGFRHLKEHVLALRPTVILMAYGFNESFEGPAGLPKFTEGLKVLLDALAPAKARIVLLTPPRQEDLGRPLPESTEQNQNIQRYGAVIRQMAGARGLTVVDLFQMLGDKGGASPRPLLTDNGIHLTAFGYWRAAAALERGLGWKPFPWRVAIEPNGNVAAEGVRVADLHTSPVAFQATDGRLPAPVDPRREGDGSSLAGFERVLQVRGLAPGRYELIIDGQSVVEADAAAWAKGVVLRRGPEFDQVEKLRSAIVGKNRQYFYRWRPQNETYLFGFRRHEQGQNAKEIPQFDPLVAKLEAEIAKRRVPVSHHYEIKPVRK